jgi:protein arginine N-methyltransferase 1
VSRTRIGDAARAAGRWLADEALERWRRLVRRSRIRRLMFDHRNRRTFADLIQHDRMLADQVRVKAYWEAIEKHISADDVVLDLGTGSGVLAAFAASRGARVHALEHGPIIEAAEAVVRDNALTANVEFHRMHSRKLALDEKVDVILHEQLGNAVFDEHAVANIADLRDRLLADGGRIYPSRLDMYLEPVQLLPDSRAPFAWQQELHGVDFRELRHYGERQLKHHGYRYRVLRPFPLNHFLCDPQPVVSVDLATVGPDDLPTRISFEREVVSAGFVDGYCVYFDAHFDDELWFTSSPAERSTNWGIPLLRVEGPRVEPGDRLRFSLSALDLADPESWSWSSRVLPGAPAEATDWEPAAARASA